MVQVALLALPEATASLVYGLYDLLVSARRDWAVLVDGQRVASPFSVHVVARQAGPLRVANDLLVQVHATLDEVPDIVCVPEVMVLPDENLSGRFSPEIDYLGRCRAAGAVIATTCTGALLLAEAGLLAGHRATTHWLYHEKLASYRDVEVVEKQSLVVSDGGHLVMAGAGTSWQDLALYLIARYAGVEEAMRTARINLIQWHNDGQQPFVKLNARSSQEDGLMQKCQIWIAENYEKPHPVASMLTLTGLPERSFHRRFKAATGLAPMEYVQAVRIEEAKQMLETQDDSIESLALAVGYEDASFFRRLFRREVGLTPAEYKKRFAGLRQRLSVAVGTGDAASR